MNTVKNITLKLFVLLMVLVMGMLVANKVLFMHSHQLTDGSIVTHAHPFNKSGEPTPDKQHQHSAAELFFIQHLDLLFVFNFLIFAFAWFFHGSQILVHYLFRPSSRFLFNPQGRAPPAC